METTDPLKIETDEDRLRICLDVVIPMMRKMEFRDYFDQCVKGAPQVYFGAWSDHFAIDKSCGTFACLGGWYERVTGDKWSLLREAYWRLQGVEVGDNILEPSHAYSNGGTARQELEARAEAIAKVLGR